MTPPWRVVVYNSVVGWVGMGWDREEIGIFDSAGGLPGCGHEVDDKDLFTCLRVSILSAFLSFLLFTVVIVLVVELFRYYHTHV